ncbi:DUF3363 domain-containing protein [Bradyrhizobium sp. DASA03120]|uniref:DUF3363 domain-containing protein n=1 Tax=Bradyrhizobium sp. SMVTL-02 TaxID=3395917 RepID=UPI003F6F5D0A
MRSSWRATTLSLSVRRRAQRCVLSFRWFAARTGLDRIDVKAGDSLTGVHRRMLTLNSGRYALIERSHDFALVPWRPVLERARGQFVTASVGGEGISWSIGIKRGIGR